MIIILGLIILAAAAVVAVAGVLHNSGSGHPVSHFSVLGYHQAGSAGTLFLLGIVVGAAGVLGLSLLLAGARRTSRRGGDARRGLRQSRRETAAVSQQRDDLIDERDTARAAAASNGSDASNGDGTGARHSRLSPGRDRRGRLGVFRHRAAAVQTDAGPYGVPPGQDEPDVAAGSPGPGVPVASSPASAPPAPE